MDIRNMLDNRINYLVYKINVFLVSLIILFAPAYSYAIVDYEPPRTKWLKELYYRSISSEAYLEAKGIKEVVENGSKKLVKAEATVSVSASEVGGVMSKRLAQAAVGGGAALLGVLAVQELLEGIGWVMEEGVYVKHKTNDIDPNAKYLYRNSEVYSKYRKDAKDLATAKALAAQFLTSIFDEVTVTNAIWNGNVIEVKYYRGDQSNSLSSFPFYPYDNPDYNPDKPKDQKIPITDEQIGCAILGTGCYHDPVDSTLDAGVNNGVGHPDIVVDAATPSPDAEQNPINKKIDSALDAAPKTTTKDGTKGSTDTTSKDGTDENGNPTKETSGDFALPAFCDWATSLCDWIDWTQKESDDEDDTEIEKEDLDISTQPDTKRVQFGSQCPSPFHGSYTILGRTFSIYYPWDAACDVATKFKPAVVGCSGLAAIYIVLGINRKTED